MLNIFFKYRNDNNYYKRCVIKLKCSCFNIVYDFFFNLGVIRKV